MKAVAVKALETAFHSARALKENPLLEPASYEKVGVRNGWAGYPHSPLAITDIVEFSIQHGFLIAI